MEIVAPEEVETVAGRGVVGVVDGVRVWVGKSGLPGRGGAGGASARYLQELGALEDQAKTAFMAGWEGEVRGVLAVSDSPRARFGWRPSQRLVSMKIGVALLTGDNARSAAVMAGRLGIGRVKADVHARRQGPGTGADEG